VRRQVTRNNTGRHPSMKKAQRKKEKKENICKSQVLTSGQAS
jgi:hypothetical protein